MWLYRINVCKMTIVEIGRTTFLTRLFLLCLSIVVAFSSCNKKETTLFVLLDSRHTGIEFNNDITESDTLNIFNSEFIYNGGGVGIGDLNGDGLQDVYFTGNQVDNKLYLNRGNLKFEDVTEKANAQKYPGQWSSGINILDINLDGKQDIYVCNTFINDPAKRKNLLFINQGNDKEGIPKFKEMAADYGIADTTHSSNAQFFDYDNDGDLDLFIAVNFMDTRYPNQYFPKVTDGSSPNADRLYRNEGKSPLGDLGGLKTFLTKLASNYRVIATVLSSPILMKMAGRIFMSPMIMLQMI